MKIFATSTQYSYVENEIIEAINAKPLDFINHSLIEYSKKINCSKSAISRVAKLLNFSSLNQMKLYVQEQIVLHNLYFDIHHNQSMIERINNIKSYNNYAINKTIEMIDLAHLKTITNQLIQAQRIHIFGVGSSYLAAYELANNLLKINYHASCSQDIHNSLLVLSNFQSNDFLILFSKTATTKEIAFLLKIIPAKKIQVLLITANETIQSRDNCFVLTHKDLNKEPRIIATSSKICQLIISDILFYEIFFQSKKNLQLVENTLVELGKWKKYK